jgi:hypothetical protein
MILPNNGTVVVIDNIPSEAEPLLRLLSMNQIPAFYFSEKQEFLPTKGLECVRVVFLDLKLNEFADEKTNISTAIQVLKRIIPENNGPYILVVWSKHGEYLTNLKQLSQVH